jgi:ABC-2 type transport system ATP-binding protein
MSIEVKHLTKVYGSQYALNDISFEAHNGQVLGFLGPNGAGKSTTMKILTGFIPQTTGEAIVCGQNVDTHPLEIRRMIGYLPESNPLYYEMYVTEYLEFSARIHQLGDKTKSRIDEMLERTGLTAERNKTIRQLSKGYKQRVGLAQAMLHDPKVLILDEPTSGLDPNQLVEIRSLIKQLGKDKTVVFSSHILQEVQAIADRIVIINKGKLVADDTASALQDKLQNQTIVRVEFKQPVTNAQLEQIKGVKSISKLNDGRWSVVSNGTTDLRESVFEFAKQKDLTLLHLEKEAYSLEEVFKQLTTTK